MKKLLMIGICALNLCACGQVETRINQNKQWFDTQYTFRYAILSREDGEELIEIKSWRDFEDGDQIQFTDKQGRVYLVHSSRVILINEKPD